MQFPVPQFIDIEDKIIGPFGLKQFGFIFTGGLIILGFFKIFNLGIAFYFLSFPIALITLYFAFAKFNGKPVYNQLPVFINFVTAPKKMIFHKDAGPLDDLNISAINLQNTMEEKQEVTPTTASESQTNKLKRISMLLDQKSDEEYEIINKQK